MTTQTRNARPRRARLVPGALALVILGLGLGAAARGQDAKTQDVDAGGLTFQAPASWKSSPPPPSGMRRAQLKVEPVKGDEDPAELVVFAFPGGAGSVDANVKRWQSQFKDKNGDLPKVELKTVKGKNVEVSRVETSGHYFPSNFPGQPKQPDRENYRLLGAIVITDNTGYFLRLVGPEKTVASIREGFDTMLTTMKKAEEK